jgi:hypothetical protein
MLFILDPIAMHEILVPCDQVKNAGLLFRTSKTLKFNAPDTSHKTFVKYKFHDLQAAVSQINGSLDPKLDLIIQAKSQLLGIMANEIGFSAEDHHIVIFHTEKVRCVLMYSKTTGDPLVRKPVGCHFTEVILRKGVCHIFLNVSEYICWIKNKS